jgi:hypothetical protein
MRLSQRLNTFSLKKCVRLVLTFGIVFTYTQVVSAQQNLTEIGVALKSGNASDLALHFDQRVDLSFLEKTNTYSKKQAQLVLQKFFAKIEPNNYTTNQKGTSSFNNTKYCIGRLITSYGEYKVYMFFILKNEKYFLKELRFEK